MVAIFFATIDLPVPGGPASSTPLGWGKLSDAFGELR
ncbi:hypothetical protein N9414_01175 [Nodularia spumigena CCY9414]|nr:hypothetical protein N9414_01175 [Nodularia spumigena CCY9414]